MTASLHTLGAGASAGNYYTQDPYRETQNRDDYYAKDGGGRWWTSGESVVRDGAAVDLASFRDLCAGRDPRTGRSLVRGAGERHRAGWDITLTSPKSFSLLWASGGANQRAQLESIHAAAVTEALEFLRDEELVEVRLGAGGYRREAPTDLMVARFDHYTTRAGDPNCHTHCVLMNIAASQDGKHRTLEPERLFSWQVVIGSAFRTALAERLTRELGVSVRTAGQGQFEIRGIPEEVISAFSKRSAAIEAAISGDRGSASGAQKEIAALATRGAKADVPTGAALEARWRDELIPFEIDPWAAVRQAAITRVRAAEYEHDRDAEPDVMFDPPEIVGETPVARAASKLFRHQNVLDRKSLIEQALDEAALQGIGIAAVRAELADLEAQGQLLRLVANEREACWTTPGIASAEATLLRAADRPVAGARFRPEVVSAALAAAPMLSQEQRDAVSHVTGPDAAGVTVLEAGAGTGKTTTAKVIVQAAQKSGLTVIGLAPSWTAADELKASTGIETFAIDKWRYDLEHGRIPPLAADTVVLCDEAGMIGTRDLAFVLSTVAAAPNGGGSAILLGDRRQLASVAGASALRSVVDVLGRHATLAEVRRQQVPWQCAASTLMARGDVEAGLRAYARHNRIDLVSGAAASQARAIALWSEARARYGDMEVLIVTRRNRDAAALNHAAREVLRTEGAITGPNVEVQARDRENKAVLLSLARGDRIRFGEGLIRHGIRNGTRATIEAVGADAQGILKLRLRLDDGRVVEDAYGTLVREPVPGAQKQRSATLPRISHAWAGTAYSVQGKTAAASVYYGATASDARELYVGLTRHTQDAWLVVEHERLETSVRLRRNDARTKPSTAELHERLFVEARRHSEKVNVVDHIEDRAAFVQTGKLPPRRREAALDPRYEFEAGRALQAVLLEIGAHPRLLIRHLGQLRREAGRKISDRFTAIIDALRKPAPSQAPNRTRAPRRRGPEIDR